MKDTKFVQRCVGYSSLVLLGVIAALCIPIENIAYGQVIHPHPDHRCVTIRCANVSAYTCGDGSLCTDMATATQFPKCMPTYPNESCDESSTWGSTNCSSGTCAMSGARCSYTLEHCIPTNPVSE